MYVFGVLMIWVFVVVIIGEQIYREGMKFGVVLIWVVLSYICVGMFQFFVVCGDIDKVCQLVDYVIVCYDLEFVDSDDRYFKFFGKVVECQVQFVVKWMLVGFVYGVMNIDNIIIFGEIIDYGFCVFLDVYDFVVVYSLIDYGGCYVYGC